MGEQVWRTKGPDNDDKGGKEHKGEKLDNIDKKEGKEDNCFILTKGVQVHTRDLSRTTAP